MISTWFLRHFYDFSPATPSIREDEFGEVEIPVTNASIEFIEEPFAGDFTDRSITGRQRSNVQGYRLSGTIEFPFLGTTDRNNMLNRIKTPQLTGTERLLRRGLGAIDYGSTTTFQLDPQGSDPLTSNIGSFYVGMIAEVGVNRSRITAYNGASRTFTVDTALTINTATVVTIYVPAGIPAGFYISTETGSSGRIACVVSGPSPVAVNVESQTFTQPFTLEIQSQELLSSIPSVWLK